MANSTDDYHNQTLRTLPVLLLLLLMASPISFTSLLGEWPQPELGTSLSVPRGDAIRNTNLAVPGAGASGANDRGLAGYWGGRHAMLYTIERVRRLFG
ncbi:hypothetical protein SAMD00023353_0800300 [Rosellinia necatrix]|uniref:Uncharacterized protein n=1 Tax=Rosellinia necatrix TaxID=77044 RepID=A0A1S8A720_ROSNE|nr:hypothetical protein SAMD00023353_0800300 [Rosellinia necatrix]